MADLITPEYKQLLRTKHDAKPWGGGGQAWAFMIAPLLNSIPRSPVTLVDFGCGSRRTFKPAMLEILPDAEIQEYDPGVAGLDDLSALRPADFVVCTDVMEHVEEQFVDKTLRHINWLAIYGVFFNIDLMLSKSFLPDGSNTHITIKPAEWWLDRLRTQIPDMDWTIHEQQPNRIVLSGKRRNTSSDE